MKKLFFSLISLIFIVPISRADEGMWLPMFIKRLNYVDMEKQGLKLTAEEIYSINNSSLKDAVPIFGRGCTSELISPEGLLLTNHHCGYGNITALSTPENNYLDNGFWAKSKNEELPAQGLSVQFLDRMEDVTAQVLGTEKPELTKEQNAQLKFEEIQKIQKKASENGKFSAVVKSFYAGNEYYLFVYKIYNDVRLVGAPPASIGKFGGDTDNWMWPRHTGDFSIFRVYADKNNQPAEYSANNVPLKSKNFFKLNIDDKKEGGFSFIMGYPGSTERYLTSWGIDYLVNTEYPAFVAARDEKLSIMRDAMSKSDKVRLNYSDNYANTANYWKNRMGMIKALNKNKTADKKRTLESEITTWINSSDQRKAKYGNMFNDFQNYYKQKEKSSKAIQWFVQGGLTGSNVAYTALLDFSDFSKANAKEDKIQSMTNLIDSHYSKVDLKLEENLIRGLLKKITTELPKEQLPKELTANINKYGSVDNLVNEIVKSSKIFQPEAIKTAILNKDTKFFNKPDLGEIIFKDIRAKYIELNDELKGVRESMDEASKLFHQALRELYDGKKVFYPDANFTMRLTYGKILPYNPQDGVTYNFETTIDGIVEKYDPNNPEFVVPDKLLDLQRKKDYGKYANSNGNIVVAFLTNHDITGGNSGSPVLNAKGELIGVAFDGNWEAMSGDIEFEPALQRTISVDIRYVLFIIDKFANAQNIIDEVVIVEKNSTPEVVTMQPIKESKKDNKKSKK